MSAGTKMHFMVAGHANYHMDVMLAPIFHHALTRALRALHLRALIPRAFPGHSQGLHIFLASNSRR
eukprot:3070489-Rhodomonas_salina.2